MITTDINSLNVQICTSVLFHEPTVKSLSLFQLCALQPPVLPGKSPLKSPVKRRSGLFPRLHSSTETPSDKHTARRSVFTI